MNGEQALEMGREAIYVMLMASLPFLLVAMVVGLVISIFQALTQLQEATLSFVPKIVVMFLFLILLLPFVSDQLGGLMRDIADKIVAIGAK